MVWLAHPSCGMQASPLLGTVREPGSVPRSGKPNGRPPALLLSKRRSTVQANSGHHYHQHCLCHHHQQRDRE